MFDQFSSDPQENLLSSVGLTSLNSNLSPENAVIVPTSGLSTEQNLNQPVTVNPADSLLLSGIGGSDTTGAVTLVDNQSSDALTGEAMNIAKGKLIELAQSPDFIAKINVPFGENWNTEVANTLKQNWLEGDFSSIPPIEIVAKGEIAGANGAFAQATNTIYLSQKFLRENGTNSQAVADVLLEEIGHSIDSKINITDSPGDEGEIFAGIVKGNEWSQGELQGLQSKEDATNIVLDGENTTIEMSQQQWTIKSYTDWRNKTIDWNNPNKTSDQSGNRQDGKDGIYIDWRIGSPFDSTNNVEGGNNPDYFATLGSTKAYFEAGGTYKFRVSADDGIIIGVQQVGQSNKTLITPQSQDGKAQWVNLPWGKEYSWNPPQTGEYNVFFQHYEKTGNAGVDISWEKVNGSYSPSPDPNRRVDNNFVKHNIGKTKGGNDRHIAFERVNSPGYIENRPTWVVIHGWRNGAGDLKDLAQAIEGYDGYQIGDQVLTLDWDGARTDITQLKAASTWIKPVGKKAAETLKGWGINSSNINLVGHSLGTYVAAEIAKNIPGGVNKIIALDPAASTAGGYKEGWVNFSDNSQWSWAFYGSAGGSYDRTYTADESFEFYFLSGANDLQKHGDVVKTFAKMIDKNNKGNAGYISKLFNLNMMNESALKTWGKPGDGYEATISVTNELEPYRLTHKNGSITESIILV